MRSYNNDDYIFTIANLIDKQDTKQTLPKYFGGVCNGDLIYTKAYLTTRYTHSEFKSLN